MILFPDAYVTPALDPFDADTEVDEVAEDEAELLRPTLNDELYSLEVMVGIVDPVDVLLEGGSEGGSTDEGEPNCEDAITDEPS